MIRRAALACVLLWARPVLATPTQAAPPATMVIVRSDGHAEFGPRLQGYLRGSTWVLDYTDGPVGAADIAPQPSARAVVWLVRRPDAPVLEVHLLDPSTSRELVREVPFEDKPGANSESAALEAAALIVGATLDEWRAEDLRLTERSAATTEPASEVEANVPSPVPTRTVASNEQTNEAANASPLTSQGTPRAAAERSTLGASAIYQGFWSGGEVRHGPAVELAWLEHWFWGVRLSWSGATWDLAARTGAQAADVRVHAATVGLLVGPRLGSAATDLWLVPAIGAEVGYVVRQTTWVAEGLDATERSSNVTIAVPARVTLETPSWCLVGGKPCAARVRLTVATVASLFVRRPSWAIRDANGVVVTSTQWGLLQPGVDVGLRAEF